MAVAFVTNDLSAVLIFVFHKRITSVRNYKIFWHNLGDVQMLIARHYRLALGAAPRSILLWRNMAARPTANFWNLAPVANRPVTTELALPVAWVFVQLRGWLGGKHNVFSLADKQCPNSLVALNSLAVHLIRVLVHSKEIASVDVAQMHPNLTLRPIHWLGFLASQVL